ncbi:ATP-binding protein [Zeaxanthinibacter sp. PT1]|uniref:ATP-binding protein n=1 Tax=Zeaxanthinibacter TaxID=561554 RepID=UPI00234A9523|nr:ATP-binding protein [Zeaxanthinibacter sp. PT1]MDC6351086.1 ATP-binding protein [Zeaxanthinibacter sp. PT1]
MEERLKQKPSDLIKIVLFGPESTGKTTLAKQLADHYKEPWVPEYAREYLQEKWEREQKTCEPHDLIPIAIGQMRLENTLAEQADRLLICDTDLLETKVYSEAYYLGSCDPLLEKYALENDYKLYFLTGIDVPWEKDDLRDKPNEREQMFDYFRSTLEKYNRNFVTLIGDETSRLQAAIAHIDKLLAA